MVTSIQLGNKTKSRLEKMKTFPKESYDDVVNRLLNVAEDDEGVLSQQTIKNIESSLAEIKAGKVLSHKEVKRKLGLK
jgi:predicted transcriptional regulator